MRKNPDSLTVATIRATTVETLAILGYSRVNRCAATLRRLTEEEMSRYRLDDLGWLQFEQLCQSLLKAELGVGIEAWGGQGDFGRDAYSADPIEYTKGQPCAGPHVFQAKFVREANAAGAEPFPRLREAVAAECNRIREREYGEWEAVSQYVLMTNAPVSATERQELDTLVKRTLPNANLRPWGEADVTSLLDNHPELRVSFPQLLGIRDVQELLQSAINKPIVERSTLAREIAIELAKVFLPTESYRRVLHVLATFNFAVLSGPPEVGKTAIARVIGLVKLTEGWECFECHNPDDLFRVRQPGRQQLFIVDDAFGTTEFSPTRAEDWEADLEKVFHALDATHWMIWTSRTAPLNRALMKLNLQGKASRFPDPGLVEVDVARLKDEEKALILYRHAKCSGMSDNHRAIIREHAMEIVRNEHFTPERVRRFISDGLANVAKEILSGGHISKVIARAVNNAIETPTKAMRKSFSALDAKHRWFLIAMLDVDSGRHTRDEICRAFERISGHEEHLDVFPVADVLSGHFLRRTSRSWYTPDGEVAPQVFYEWMHPSWRDLVIDRLSSSSVERRQFLSRCSQQGIALALSGFGGEKGTRELPLLRDDDDWRCLTSSFIRIIEDDVLNARHLLSSLREAHRRTAVSGNDDVVSKRIANVISTFLERLRARMDESCVQIPPVVFELFFELSFASDSLCSSPTKAIQRAWNSLVAGLHALREMGHRQRDYEKIVEWAELIKVLEEYEPRAYKFFGVSDRFHEAIESLLASVQNATEVLPPSVIDPSELDREIESLSQASEALEAIRDVFHHESRQIESVSDSVSDVLTKCREIAESLRGGSERDSGAAEARKRIEGNTIAREALHQIFKDL